VHFLALPGLAVPDEILAHQSFTTTPLVDGLAAMVFLTSFFGFRVSLFFFT
jgi:hypothetical protein